MSEAAGLFDRPARALRGVDGRRDLAAAHAGLPVTAGEKWIASRWIRERMFELPVDRAG